MNKIALIETSYLPSIDYICLIFPYQTISIEKFEFFEKQTHRNRCHLNTSQGSVMLSAPLDGRHGKVLTKDVRVEDGNKWRNTHWRTIESAYRSAPYFEFYADELRAILYSGHKFLIDLNFDLLSFCLQSLKINKELSATMTYEQDVVGIDDLRNCVSAKKSEAPIKNFQITPYRQVFGSAFVKGLSVIDLLFCCGPDSHLALKSSQPVNKI